MNRWAIFDIDGTLLPGTSMERIFLQKAFREGLLTARQIGYFCMEALRLTPRYGITKALKQNKAFFRGMPVTKTEQFAATVFTNFILPKFSEQGMEQVQHCRENGYRILLMSGAPEFLVQHLQNKLAPDYVIASQLEKYQGHFTGRLLRPHPFGMEKKHYLLNLQERLQIDFARSVVFANHYSDIYHMQLFGKAVAVNPGSWLRRHARKQGWGVEYWQ